MNSQKDASYYHMEDFWLNLLFIWRDKDWVQEVFHQYWNHNANFTRIQVLSYNSFLLQLDFISVQLLHQHFSTGPPNPPPQHQHHQQVSLDPPPPLTCWCNTWTLPKFKLCLVQLILLFFKFFKFVSTENVRLVICHFYFI